MFVLNRAVIVSSLLALAGCAYSQLTPAGTSVIATASKPTGQCRSLGTITGKGGGGGGGFVSNEKLVEFAINDLRNQAGAMGATHVQTLTPNFGSTGDSNTTTSATVMGEALACTGNEPASSGGAAPAVGCQHDAQCKGERICVANQCVAPAAPAAQPTASQAAQAPAATVAPATTQPPVGGGAPGAPAPQQPAVR